MDNRLKLGLLFFIILFVGVSSYYILEAISRSGKYLTEITVAPQDSRVEIGGVRVSGSEIYLAPGSYEYTVSREHFTEKRGVLKISTDKEKHNLIVPLSPSDQEGEAIYKQKLSEYANLEDVAGAEAAEIGEAFRDKNPVVNKLPYNNHLFSIGYKTDASDDSGNTIIITVHADPVYRGSAINQISLWGFNPAEYKIEFVGEENPFK